MPAKIRIGQDSLTRYTSAREVSAARASSSAFLVRGCMPSDSANRPMSALLAPVQFADLDPRTGEPLRIAATD